MVICISIVVATQIWLYKSTKRYENIPAYGTKNPLLLMWQHCQQIRTIGKISPPASFLNFFSSGDKHTRRRKLLQPAFHSRILENHVARFNEHSLILVNKLKSVINEPWIDITPVITTVALDILCHTILGTDIGSQQGNHEAIEYLEAIDELESFKLEEECNEYDQHSKRTSKSFLDLLLEYHVKDPSFTIEDVQEEVNTFLFAGHDTSTIAVCWVLYLLGLHPEVQNKVYQEQCSIFGDNKIAEATNEDVKNMLYLESVIKETLRLYPPAPIIARENKESIKIGSYTIPPKTQIAFLIYMLHRDPEVFLNPEKFDPGRFSSENIGKHDAFSYIPFSAGRRSCIGQRYAMGEMKIILSHIVRNFKVTSLDPREEMKIYMKVTLKCLDLMRQRLSLRSNGEKNRSRRRLLQPTFHSRILEDYISIFNEHSLILVSKLKKMVNEPSIDISDLIVTWALDIICHTAMGIRINAQEGSQETMEYVKAVEEFLDLVMYRLLRPWLKSDFIFYRTSAGQRYLKVINTYHNFTRKVIQEKKEFIKLDKINNEKSEYSEKGSKAFLEFLLEQHAKHPDFTLDDVREEVDTFMFAGHDTSTIAMSWALYLLGLHPDIQQKVFQELYFIFGDDKTRDVSKEDLKNMIYLEQVIKETIRLYPAASITIRENEEAIKVGSYTIPARSHIATLVYMLHRDPEMFPNPEKFDPDRFSSENIRKRDTYSYIPFSVGTRSCIGQKFAMMEMKVALSHVIRNFRVTAIDPRDKMNVFVMVTLKCLSPIRLRFFQRQ
ncbi:probable cytochrome P450 4ac3 [Stegodyphus dumicola]|uniref:probable cytochrome P450 4ac3 n=1 Tax=Stegodyphus dumicola TaxID=202533 RepID=UPI0015AE077A|nr:probable cytochrome P450 4ac3 [Stegodyphus dumicola]